MRKAHSAAWFGSVALLASGPLATVATAQSAPATYEVLDPRGAQPPIARIPLSPRLRNVTGKRIYVVKSWPRNSGFDEVLGQIANALSDRGAIVTVKDRNIVYSTDDPALWEEMRAKADAFVYVAAASSSTTSYAFKWSALLEKMGLPGVVVNFSELGSVGDQTSEREGARLRRATFDYPPLAMPKANFDVAIARILSGLTAPLTRAEIETGIVQPPRNPPIAARGTLQEIQDSFYQAGFTDGLPIMPPTPQAVQKMLTGTSHPADEVVSQGFPPEGLIATVRDVAVNGVMAGCGPEHMSVLLASMEAFQKYNMNSMLRSTNSFSFMQVVNGPIRQQISMNSGTNAVGPGNRSNSCTGRALRLFITNLGGGRWGTNLMAVIGNVSNYAFLFAENEEASPWPSLAVSNGFKPTDSVLTLFEGGFAHSGNYGLGTRIEDVPPDIAGFKLSRGAAVIVSPARAASVKADGKSKDDLERFFQEKACVPLGTMRQEGQFTETAVTRGQPDTLCVPRFEPGTVKVIVAGNDASPMMQAWQMYRPLSVSIDRWR
ncbi:MAG: hypothetical protein ABIO62_03280 [Paracoccaceae bacterium]